ncbi:MAG: hypothetical protein IMZ55_15765, partial [Acidobacteria bacterium]|nr:hypothetical protein [Acidobacteriota bacterium]
MEPQEDREQLAPDNIVEILSRIIVASTTALARRWPPCTGRELEPNARAVRVVRLGVFLRRTSSSVGNPISGAMMHHPVILSMVRYGTLTRFACFGYPPWSRLAGLFSRHTAFPAAVERVFSTTKGQSRGRRMSRLFLSFCASRHVRILTLAGAVLITVAVPDVALAQASRLGEGFHIPYVPYPVHWPKRFPAIAYDSVNNVYLTVSGIGTIGGAFVSADGVPVGAPFAIVPGIGALGTSLAYSPDAQAFLVTWMDEPALSVWGQIIGYGAGGVATPVTGPFLIKSVPGGLKTES